MHFLLKYIFILHMISLKVVPSWHQVSTASGQEWFKQWRVTCSIPSHCFNNCWPQFTTSCGTIGSQVYTTFLLNHSDCRRRFLSVSVQDMPSTVHILSSGIMRPANKRRRCNVTSSLIGWVHAQNYPMPCFLSCRTNICFRFTSLARGNISSYLIAPMPVK